MQPLFPLYPGSPPPSVRVLLHSDVAFSHTQLLSRYQSGGNGNPADPKDATQNGSAKQRGSSISSWPTASRLTPWPLPPWLAEAPGHKMGGRPLSARFACYSFLPPCTMSPYGSVMAWASCSRHLPPRRRCPLPQPGILPKQLISGHGEKRGTGRRARRDKSGRPQGEGQEEKSSTQAPRNPPPSGSDAHKRAEPGGDATPQAPQPTALTMI